MVEETFPILWPQVAQLRYASLQGKEKQNMESDIFRLEEAFFKMCIQIGYDSVMCHNKCRANITDTPLMRAWHHLNKSILVMYTKQCKYTRKKKLNLNHQIFQTTFWRNLETFLCINKDPKIIWSELANVPFVIQSTRKKCLPQLTQAKKKRIECRSLARTQASFGPLKAVI